MSIFLQAAAESLAYLDTGMQYPAEVGVNSYVKVKMSFLQKQVNIVCLEVQCSINN